MAAAPVQVASALGCGSALFARQASPKAQRARANPRALPGLLRSRMLCEPSSLEFRTFDQQATARSRGQTAARTRASVSMECRMVTARVEGWVAGRSWASGDRASRTLQPSLRLLIRHHPRSSCELRFTLCLKLHAFPRFNTRSLLIPRPLSTLRFALAQFDSKT